MEASEIRAIRGSLSRAAFARLLGVTSLTVLRWELPSDNKEARRPRAKMIEALRKLAAEGVGTSAAAAVEDEEDVEASEPVASSIPPRPSSQPIESDEARLSAALRSIWTEDWERGESELTALLASAELTTAAGRALATLGLVQLQLLMRFELRGALTTLLPIVEEGERGRLPRSVAGRAHVLAAMLFASPSTRSFDPGRANAHAARAEELLEHTAYDLRVVLAVARFSAARFAGSLARVRIYNDAVPVFERAISPVAAAFAAEVRLMMLRMTPGGEVDHAQADESLQRAERLGLAPLVASMLADRMRRLLFGTGLPHEVLALTERARTIAKSMPPNEMMVRILAYEMEAYLRQGKIADVERVAQEALDIASRGAVPADSIVGTAARLYASTLRVEELEKLAQRIDVLNTRTDPSKGLVSDVHALHLRATAALFTTQRDRALEISNALREKIDALMGTPADLLTHETHVVYVFAQIFGGDVAAARAAVQRFEALLEVRPSLWHSAVVRVTKARILVLERRMSEARQQLESALGIFDTLGDILQVAQAKLDLALLARKARVENAEAMITAAEDQLAQFGIMRPAMPKDALPGLLGAFEPGWSPDTLIERVALGVERLSARGLPSELMQRELTSVLQEIFPGRSVRVEPSSARQSKRPEIAQWLEVQDGASKLWRIGVAGELDVPQSAALRTLVAVVELSLEATRLKAVTPSAQLEADPELPGFIAAASGTRQLKREIAQLARASSTILITGESGSGKEVVAHALHQLSPRASKPYIAFNCASVPRELFEGQLFGYRKGAFTGAVSDNVGVIRAADGGTLFLDEIGELPLDVQPKLLRFLENGDVTPLGEQKPRQVDVRVLAATHRDLGRLVREGQFREDLYYRLNVIPVRVPPLRERKEDIVALARMFVSRLAGEAEPPDLGPDAIAMLESHSWPGNVRELRNVIERALAYAPSGLLRAEHLRVGA